MCGMRAIIVLLVVIVGVDVITAQACLDAYDSFACVFRRDGDYNACPPECSYGTFVKCSNGIAKKSPCALGWYKLPEIPSPIGRFTGRLVFDPPTGLCLEASESCPRSLDNFVDYHK